MLHSIASKIDAHQLAARMVFPNDDDKRLAYALHMKHGLTASRGLDVILRPEEFLLLTSKPHLSWPELEQSANEATLRGQNAAWPFVEMYIAAPDSNPTLAKMYRKADEVKKDWYREKREAIRADRKMFEEMRKEFSTVLHFWMATVITAAATGNGPRLKNDGDLNSFVKTSEACANYLASIVHVNRHAPPVDVSKLHRVNSIAP
jgi:hypothetical protein